MTAMIQRQPTDRASIEKRLAEVNERAMEVSRRGLGAVRDNAHYADIHANLDYLLTVLEANG